MSEEVITRKQAKQLGRTIYFTGLPCVNGHVCYRRTCNGCCVVCAIERTKQWRDGSETHLKVYNSKYKKKYRVRNREKLRKLRAKYYRVHKAAILAKCKTYVEANRVAVYARGHNRRAKLRGNGGRFGKDDIAFLLKTQKGKCINCGKSVKKRRHIDHIVPISRGGSNDRRNIQLLCITCNCSKGAKDPVKWAQEQGRLL